jgi:hypothetical protein
MTNRGADLVKPRIRPSLTAQGEWMVVKVAPTEKLKGEIVELRGRIKSQDGRTSLGAKGRILVTDRL